MSNTQFQSRESVVQSGSWWITCGSKQFAFLFLEMTCSWMIFVVRMWDFCSYNQFWILREGQIVWWSIVSIWIVPSTFTLVMVQLMSKVENDQPKVACDRRKKERKKELYWWRWKPGTFDAYKSCKWVGCWILPKTQLFMNFWLVNGYVCKNANNFATRACH